MPAACLVTTKHLCLAVQEVYIVNRSNGGVQSCIGVGTVGAQGACTPPPQLLEYHATLRSPKPNWL